MIVINLMIFLCSFTCKNTTYEWHSANNSLLDTLYVLFEDEDLNNIKKSNKIEPEMYRYPKDWERSYHIINKNVHVWFTYFNSLPSSSDLKFEFKRISDDYLKNRDLKDQEWFRNNSKANIIQTFSGNDKIIYLIEESRINTNDAIMIRVYFNYPAEE